MNPLHLFIYSILEVAILSVISIWLGSRKVEGADAACNSALGSLLALVGAVPGFLGVVWSIIWSIKLHW